MREEVGVHLYRGIAFSHEKKEMPRAIRMDLEGTMLSELSQREKGKPCTTREPHNLKGTENSGVVARGEGSGGGAVGEEVKRCTFPVLRSVSPGAKAQRSGHSSGCFAAHSRVVKGTGFKSPHHKNKFVFTCGDRH